MQIEKRKLIWLQMDKDSWEESAVNILRKKSPSLRRKKQERRLGSWLELFKFKDWSLSLLIS